MFFSYAKCLMIGVFLTYIVPHWTCLFISIHFCQCEHEETRGTKKDRFGAGEIAKWLRVLAASCSRLQLDSRTLVGRLMATCNSSTRWFDISLRALRVLSSCVHLSPQKDTLSKVTQVFKAKPVECSFTSHSSHPAPRVLA